MKSVQLTKLFLLIAMIVCFLCAYYYSAWDWAIAGLISSFALGTMGNRHV